jgi:predicted dehydrogenase
MMRQVGEEVLRFGLVGAGRIAEAYAQAFDGLKLGRLIGVADVRAEAARGLALRVGCRGYDSHEEMADECPLDAVIICTPPASHAEIALDFLRREVNVLCEKPLSVDLHSARLMLHAARRFGVRLTMASKFRYAADVVRARNIVQSGILGELLLVENTFASRADMSTRWNSRREVSGGGVLIDNGTHSVDILRYFLGPLADVQVVEGKRSQGLEVEETVQMFVRSAGGVLGRVELSWGMAKEQESYLNIFGTEGTVSVGWKVSKYRQSSGKDWVVFGQGYDKVQAFRAQLSNFCRAILGEEALLITPADALASVEVIESAYAALRRSNWTPIGGGRAGEAAAELMAEPETCLEEAA